MSTEEIARCIGALGERRFGHLVLTGGEPLLREDLPDIVSEASGAGMHSLLLTNGELLTEELCGLLRRKGLGAVSVSVDSVEKGPSKSSLDAALIARRAGLPVTLITVITKGNIGCVEDLREWARGENIGIIFQPAYVPPGSDRYRGLSLHELNGGEWLKLRCSLDSWADEHGEQTYLSLFYSLYEGGGEKPRYCDMGREAVVVDCDGSVYPCFHRRDLFCGNLVSDNAGAIFDRLQEKSVSTATAPCYGEHCISLFFGQV